MLPKETSSPMHSRHAGGRWAAALLLLLLLRGGRTVSSKSLRLRVSRCLCIPVALRCAAFELALL